jgi:phage major head subunit gpT-like protein
VLRVDAGGAAPSVEVSAPPAADRDGRAPSALRVPLAEATRRAAALAPGALVGARVRKPFGEDWYDGKAVLYDGRKGLYRVVYGDGDAEEMNAGEVLGVLHRR